MNTNDDDFISNVRLGDNLDIAYTHVNETFTNTKINLLYMNINSIRNKLADLLVYISNFGSIVHIICITEIRLNPDETYICNIPNYDVVCCPRSNRSGGGACMFIHQSMQFDVTKNEEFLEGSCIVVSLREPKLSIAVIYRPPHASLNDSIHYLDSLLESAGKLVCVGDFNINLLSTNSSNYVSMVESNGFSFLNKIDHNSATHGNVPTGTIIDHSFTNLYSQKFCMCIDNISFTDHKALLISFGSNNRLSNNVKITIIKKYNYGDISHDLAQFVVSADSLDNLNQLIEDCMSKNSYVIHSHRKYRPKAPWIDEIVLREIRHRDQLYQRMVQWPQNSTIRNNNKKTEKLCDSTH